jgi:hypothetical protein
MFFLCCFSEWGVYSCLPIHIILGPLNTTFDQKEICTRRYTHRNIKSISFLFFSFLSFFSKHDEKSCGLFFVLIFVIPFLLFLSEYYFIHLPFLPIATTTWVTRSKEKKTDQFVRGIFCIFL